MRPVDPLRSWQHSFFAIQYSFDRATARSYISGHEPFWHSMVDYSSGVYGQTQRISGAGRWAEYDMMWRSVCSPPRCFCPPAGPRRLTSVGNRMISHLTFSGLLKPDHTTSSDCSKTWTPSTGASKRGTRGIISLSCTFWCILGSASSCLSSSFS